ncbi:MAG: pentapeptide repeat-containing protein [Spirulina sp.]
MSAVVRGPHQGKRLRGRTVAQLYAEGQRNFAGAILRGANLQEQILSQADFSYTDIRGANFARATLQNANFSHAQGGLPQLWGGLKLLLVLALVAAIGFLSTAMAMPLAGTILGQFDPQTVLGVIVLGLIVIIPVGLLLAANLVLRLALWVAGDNAGNLLMAAAISFPIALLMTLMLLENGATAVSVLNALLSLDRAMVVFFMVWLIAAAGMGAADPQDNVVEMGDWMDSLLIILTGLSGVVLGAEDSFQLASDRVVPLEIVMLVTGVMFGIMPFLCIYTYRWLGQSTQQPSRLRDWGLWFTTLGGTRFSGANLTGSTFARSSLKHTRFVPDSQPTILANVCWQDARHRNRAWFAHSDQP